MAGITILEPEDYERIAAGEVIERPASVVKELIENSLDAGADRLHVDIGDGGQKWIRVMDNGDGIAARELEKAVLPHATSKISGFDDIERVRSFGFRGEALASMAAVARLRIVSLAQGADEAREIVVQGGKVLEQGPASRAPGTTIELTYLFFNTPARRKFIKSARSEFGSIAETVLRYAFGAPGLAVRLDHNGEKALELGARPKLEARMRQLLPKLKAASFVEFEAAPDAGARVCGIFVAPTHTYHNRNRQFFYLNGRYVKDRALTHAVDRFFSDRTPRGRFPIIVLNLEMDPSGYDVNVHPTKTEVRFRSPSSVHHLVTRALEAATGGPAHISLPPRPDPRPAAGEQVRTAPPLELATQDREPRRAGPAPAPRGDAAEFAGLLKQGALFELPVGRLTVLGQIQNQMIVAYDKTEVHFIDGHALHERLLYDRFIAEAGSPSAQMLLTPARIELDPVTVERIAANAAELEKLGFDVEAFGDDSIAVRSAPMALPRESLIQILDQFLGGFREYSTTPTRATLARDLATAACKRAVVFGVELSAVELQRLVQAYEQAGYELTCPHGRPVAFRMPIAGIKKKLDR